MIYLNKTSVRTEIVRFEQDYLYSFGSDYYGNGSGLIDIVPIWGEEEESGDSSSFVNP